MELPTELVSMDTLLFLGLHESRARQIWQKFLELRNEPPYFYDEELGAFAKDCLQMLVESEDCDIGEPGVDWSSSLRKIGANEDLVCAIRGFPGDEHGIRLTQSAAEWVLNAIEWRWEGLSYINQAVEARSVAPGRDLIPETRNDPHTSDVEDELDVSKILWNRKACKSIVPKGKEINHVPLWKCVTRVQAEAIWSGKLRTGTFDINRLRSMAPSSFSAHTLALYWTPDLEAAQMYASFCKRIAAPAQLCLIRIELPLEILQPLSTKVLQFPNEKWKKLVYHSHRGRPIEPRDLLLEVLNTSLLIGDATSGINSQYIGMKRWEDVTDKHTLKLESNQEIVTQFVFGHNVADYEVVEAINELEHKVTVRDAEQPNLVLPPY